MKIFVDLTTLVAVTAVSIPAALLLNWVLLSLLLKAISPISKSSSAESSRNEV